MSVVKIQGVDVKFAYEKPYPLQVDYMDKVLQCLEGKRHGVLESPTGTGKTLCLFAPVTSWLRSKKAWKTSRVEQGGEGRTPRIWYTARTHSQIAQTVSEVRRCDIEGLSIRVMGARDQLCIHPNVMNEKESHVKTIMCKEMVKNRSCKYYRNLDYEKHSHEVYMPGEVLDIEDLAGRGQQCGICPYHLARQARDHADIVLMPYNYVIDRESRGSDSGAYHNSVVIFDEGHNVPNTCEESFEFSLSSVDLALGIKNVQELMEHLAKLIQQDDHVSGEESQVDLATHADSCIKMLKPLKNLEAQLANFPISSTQYPLKDLFAFFEKAEITAASAPSFLLSISEFQKDSAELALTGQMITTLNLFERMLQTLFGQSIQSFDPDKVEKSFKFVVSKDSDVVQNSKKLSLYCFNPSFGIKDVLLLGVESMILTSGTLSPLRNFIQEMGLPDPITLENGHIATKEQVPFMILGTGVNNVRMDASFQNRTNPDYMHSLGMSLTNLISSVPDGVLLLFSSYSVMQSLKEYWEGSCGVWNRLQALKRVFLEPRQKEEFINCMENYRRAIDSGNGALLMGVLRGKISEGMDFKNQYCRAVFIVGVPFPPVMDPRVKGKTNYAENLMIENPKTKKMEYLYPSKSFISVEAMKATNQAIGRVIRHAADYGAIVLVDYRFARPGLFNNISGWLRGERAVEVNFPIAKKQLREFFKRMADGLPGVPEVRCQAVNANGDPIAGNKAFDLYDHKTSSKRYTPAPYLATGSDTGRFSRKKHNLQFEDFDSSVGIKMYSVPTDAIPSSPQSSQSFLEAYESSNAKQSNFKMMRNKRGRSSRVQSYSSPKRKNEEPSQSASTGKRSRLPMIQLNDYEPEPEPVAETSTHDVIKADIISYIQRTKNRLEPSQAVQFKDVVWRYMKGDINFLETVEIVQTLLLSLEDGKSILTDFRKCVLPKDRKKWDEISSTWT